MSGANAEASGQPSVSVIIPTFNGAATLGAQLDALREQRYAGPCEILVVDNRSSDGTAELVARYRTIMPNLRLVDASERQGRSYAINVGAQAASGSLLLFCDSDDIVAPDWVAALVAALQTHELVCGAVDLERLNPGDVPRPHPRCGTAYKALGFLPYAIGANMGVRRTVFVALGGFEEQIAKCEDVDFSWRAQLKGYQLADAPEALVYYRSREDTGSALRQVRDYAVAHVWLFRRYRKHGMPASSHQHALARYRRIVQGLPRVLRRGWRGRSAWLIDVGTAWGRLLGSVRYRRMYL